MHYPTTIYYWVKDVSLFEHLQQKYLNQENVKTWKHSNSFDRKDIQDTRNKKTYLHEISENVNKTWIKKDYSKFNGKHELVSFNIGLSLSIKMTL